MCLEYYKFKMAKKKPGTRNATSEWIIGQWKLELPQNVLPTRLDVLKTFFYNHKSLNKTVSESANLTADQLINVWNKARIPISYKTFIVLKIKKLYDEYLALKKNKQSKQKYQKTKVEQFTINQNLLFDIAHINAIQLIKIEEDKLFLIDQRGPRLMGMGSKDHLLAKLEERSLKRKLDAADRQQKELQRRSRPSLQKKEGNSGNISELMSDSSSHTTDSDKEDQDFEVEIPTYFKIKAKSELTTSVCKSSKSTTIPNILNSIDVSSTLDRINLSNQKFAMLAASIAKANNENLTDAALSSSTIRRRRIKHRSIIDQSIKQNFAAINKPPLVVHWDGKRMKDATNEDVAKRNKFIERLPIVVTGLCIEKILGIAKLAAGSGEEQAEATIQCLTLWGVSDDVIGMCFDTTSSNTGTKKGACILLEQKIGRNLLHFACRHHIFELVIGGVFEELMGPSRGPNISLFERFQQKWSNIDKTKFKPLNITNIIMMEEKENTIMFLKEILFADQNRTTFFSRGDYREIAELCLIILGELPDCNYHFKLPGAYHQARWMAKVIYAFKIFVFREQFKLTTKELNNLEQFCLFASIIYVKAWLSSPIPSDAAINDLNFFKNIKHYIKVNEKISKMAEKKFKNHLWYLGGELVPLSLFSEKVNNDAKRLIIQQLKMQPANDWTERNIKLTDVINLENVELHQLVKPSSMAALKSLRIDIDFLFSADPSEWNDIPQYIEAKSHINSLKVVNDTAERSVALMATFNESITKKEDEMQRLIQVVQDNRQRVPDSKKRTLIKVFS